MKLSQLLSRFDHQQTVVIMFGDAELYHGLCQDAPFKATEGFYVDWFKVNGGSEPSLFVRVSI